MMKQKEYHGPTPHSIAIRAQTEKKKQDVNKLLKRWREDEAKRKEYMKFVKFHENEIIKYHWDRKLTISCREGILKQKAAKVYQEENHNFADRQIKLIDLLSKEKENFFNELQKETNEDRYLQTKQLVKNLKEVREKERLGYVDSKLKQQFRESSEEFRNLLNRQHLGQVCRDRNEQLVVKAEKKRLDQEREKMFADLWEKDRLQKAEREELEIKEKEKSKSRMVGVLNSQIASRAAQKKEERRLSEEESKLFLEEMQLLQNENEMSQRHEREMKKERLKILDKELKLKQDRIRKEQELKEALDKKIFQKSRADQNFDIKEEIKQKQYRKEMDFKYRQYLEEQRKIEKLNEGDFQRLIDEDVAMMWEKKMQKVRMEKEARSKFLLDVLKSRREQIQLKHDLIANEREELKRDRETAIKAAEEQKRIDEERKSITKLINKKHQSDLMTQIKYMENLKKTEKEAEQKEFEESVKAEGEYQRKLQELLTSSHAYDKRHPQHQKPPSACAEAGDKIC